MNIPVLTTLFEAKSQQNSEIAKLDKSLIHKTLIVDAAHYQLLSSTVCHLVLDVFCISDTQITGKVHPFYVIWGECLLCRLL